MDILQPPHVPQVINTTEKEYDAIAEEYKKAAQREMRLFALEPALKKYFAEVSGKKVLDLACGEGNSSRLMKSLGATRVVGVSLSSKEIELAKQQELTDNLGIEYHVGDATKNLENIGTFDVVTAVMLLHYCPDKETLHRLVKNIKAHLTSGGVFITSTANPKVAPNYDGYGMHMESASEEEGSPYQVTLGDFQGNTFCTFTSFYWKENTYREIFEQEGFDVEWFDSFISEEGIKKYGTEFWDKFNKNPIYSILKATRRN